MNIEIVEKPLCIKLYGVSGPVADQNYGRTGQQLMGVLWKEIGARKLNHKGINLWVYEALDMLFTGVELEEAPARESVLEPKEIQLSKYVYWKHVGPYAMLKKVHADLRDELKTRGLEPRFPFLEVYGHWTEDESKLETELFISLD
jgi:hypothetical protein